MFSNFQSWLFRIGTATTRPNIGNGPRDRETKPTRKINISNGSVRLKQKVICEMPHDNSKGDIAPQSSTEADSLINCKKARKRI